MNTLTEIPATKKSIHDSNGTYCVVCEIAVWCKYLKIIVVYGVKLKTVTGYITYDCS